MLLIPLTLSAQDTPRVEVFGGYSYLRPNEHLAPYGLLDSTHMNGWQGAVKFNLNSRIGIVSEAGGNYGTAKGEIFGFENVVPIAERYRVHTFLFGPEFRVAGPADRKWSLNLRALGGFARQSGLTARVPPGTFAPGSALGM
jgi:hypothetical protein